MQRQVATSDPTAVEMEVQGAYLEMFSGGDQLFVPKIFGWAIECFTGQYGDYQPVDALYHDFEHTLQGTLCLARLLHGRHEARAEPLLPERQLQLTLLAILLHDTGYLKRRGDGGGTGAKYTITHVSRSADFAAQLLAAKRFQVEEIRSVQNMILCTGVNANLDAIPFQSEIERICGFALVSADLLGQMAAEDYVEKLPTLYAEFAEAVAFSGDQSHFIAGFASADELILKTPAFWNLSVLPKLERQFRGVYRFLNEPYPDGPNPYVRRIEANLDRLRRENSGH